MKFKQDGDFRALKITDKDNDTFEALRFDDEKAVYLYVNGTPGVRVTRKKAIKLALAILDELDPVNTW